MVLGMNLGIPLKESIGDDLQRSFPNSLPSKKKVPKIRDPAADPFLRVKTGTLQENTAKILFKKYLLLCRVATLQKQQPSLRHSAMIPIHNKTISATTLKHLFPHMGYLVSNKTRTTWRPTKGQQSKKIS